MISFFIYPPLAMWKKINELFLKIIYQKIKDTIFKSKNINYFVSLANWGKK